MPMPSVLPAAATCCARWLTSAARSTMPTRQPSRENSLAIASPMPLAPPRTTAVWPRSSSSISRRHTECAFYLAVELIHFGRVQPPGPDAALAQLFAVGIEIDAAAVLVGRVHVHQVDVEDER